MLLIVGSLVVIVGAAVAGLYVIGGRGPHGQPNGSIMARLQSGLTALTESITPQNVFHFNSIEF